MTVDDSNEILRLRTTMRDLFALSAVPEVWVAREPAAIAAELVDVLIQSLQLDFGFVRLCDPTGRQTIEAMRGDSWTAFPEWLQQRLAVGGVISQKQIVSNVGGVPESCSGILIPIGVNGQRGFVAAACGRCDFPDQIDQQLISVAANSAATAFQNACLINELRGAQQALREHEAELRKAHDELELKVAERTLELRRSERELRDVIDTIPTIAWSALPDGSNNYVNKRFVEYSGLSAEQAAGPGWQGAIHPDDLQPHLSKWMASVATGKPHESEVRFRRADGHYRWHLDRGVPLRDEAGNIVKWYGVVTDIEERKKAEFYLAEASRIATVAELSASIAHELNQPLMSVLANAQAGKRWLAANPPNLLETKASIERIIRDARAAGEVVQHIRGLFKHESFEKQQVSIRDVLSEAVRFLHGAPRKHDVLIDWQLDEFLPMLSVDLTQVQQVFINLFSNAMEALEDSQTSPHILVRASAMDQNQILIQVIDNGPGIADHEKIFKAFVTTKRNGMGIGLAVSRSIVEAHGGRLWAENNPSGGATFSVALPLPSGQSNSSSSYAEQTDSNSPGIVGAQAPN